MEKKIVSCSVCGEMFVDVSGKGEHVCGECMANIKAQEKKIDEYLAKNPNAKVADISAHTDVAIDVIKRVVGGDSVSYPCKKCGAPIIEGEYCLPCLQKFRQALRPKSKSFSPARKKNIQVTATPQDHNSRMYILNKGKTKPK